eukprot:TRINITY_DN65228_c0_g1_i1.p1 TRINITY_DN65228_c0_g1~~TRINITY_DN65228_c0_g1_i1.p1  ORF type:complete len:922 (+),score=83.36 TRINITY_DN65228_c0_g1_i1:98-2863(+)
MYNRSQQFRIQKEEKKDQEPQKDDEEVPTKTPRLPRTMQSIIGQRNPLVDLDLVAHEKKLSDQNSLREKHEKHLITSHNYLAAAGVQFPHGVSIDETVDTLRKYLLQFYKSADFFKQAVTRFFKAVKRLQQFARMAKALKQAKFIAMYEYWCSKEETVREYMKKRIQRYKRANPFSHVINSNQTMWRDYLQCRIPKALKMRTIAELYDERKKRFTTDWKEYAKVKVKLDGLARKEERLMNESGYKLTPEIERLQQQRKLLVHTPEPRFRMDLHSVSLLELLLRAMEIEDRELKHSGYNYYEPDTSGEQYPKISHKQQLQWEQTMMANYQIEKARREGFTPAPHPSSDSHKYIGVIRSAFLEDTPYYQNPRLLREKEQRRERLQQEAAAREEALSWDGKERTLAQELNNKPPPPAVIHTPKNSSRRKSMKRAFVTDHVDVLSVDENGGNSSPPSPYNRKQSSVLSIGTEAPQTPTGKRGAPASPTTRSAEQLGEVLNKLAALKNTFYDEATGTTMASTTATTVEFAVPTKKRSNSPRRAATALGDYRSDKRAQYSFNSPEPTPSMRISHHASMTLRPTLQSPACSQQINIPRLPVKSLLLNRTHKFNSTHHPTGEGNLAEGVIPHPTADGSVRTNKTQRQTISVETTATLQHNTVVTPRLSTKPSNPSYCPPGLGPSHVSVNKALTIRQPQTKSNRPKEMTSIVKNARAAKQLSQTEQMKREQEALLKHALSTLPNSSSFETTVDNNASGATKTNTGSGKGSAKHTSKRPTTPAPKQPAPATTKEHLSPPQAPATVSHSTFEPVTMNTSFIPLPNQEVALPPPIYEPELEKESEFSPPPPMTEAEMLAHRKKLLARWKQKGSSTQKKPVLADDIHYTAVPRDLAHLRPSGAAFLLQQVQTKQSELLEAAGVSLRDAARLLAD